jgi:hypothetical protein
MTISIAYSDKWEDIVGSLEYGIYQLSMLNVTYDDAKKYDVTHYLRINWGFCRNKDRISKLRTIRRGRSAGDNK